MVVIALLRGKSDTSSFAAAARTAGRYLLAENQDSDNITVFAIGEDGRLTKQESYAFGSPVCIRFFKKTAF